MTELTKDQAKKPFLERALSRSLKSVKEIIRLLGLAFFLLIAPYAVVIVVNLAKLVICGTLNLSEFIVDFETNGISSVNNFYFGVIEKVRDLLFRLTH